MSPSILNLKETLTREGKLVFRNYLQYSLLNLILAILSGYLLSIIVYEIIINPSEKNIFSDNSFILDQKAIDNKPKEPFFPNSLRDARGKLSIVGLKNSKIPNQVQDEGAQNIPIPISISVVGHIYNHDKSVAFINVNNSLFVFAIGEEIQPNIFVHDIKERGDVVISNNGVLQEYKSAHLNDDENNLFKNNIKNNNVNRLEKNNNQKFVGKNKKAAIDGRLDTSYSKQTQDQDTKEKKLRVIMSNLKQRPIDILKYVGFKYAYSANNKKKIEGLETIILPQYTELAKFLNIRNGDVIYKINDIEVIKFVQDINSSIKLLDNSSVRLYLKRNGNFEFVTLNLDRYN